MLKKIVLGKRILMWSQRIIHRLFTNYYSLMWTEEPGGLQSIGSLRVGHDWVTSLSLFTFMHWRRKRQLTPVFSPGESQGCGSLVGCHLWSRTESDTTEATQQQQQCIFILRDLVAWLPDDHLSINSSTFGYCMSSDVRQ